MSNIFRTSFPRRFLHCQFSTRSSPVLNKRQTTSALQMSDKPAEKFPFTPSADQYVNKNWKPGDGANDDEWKKHKKIEIDPYGDNRNPIDNYKLLVSAVSPRPIGFIATKSKDGKHNLSPFSYFNVFNSDPPVFCVGITVRSRKDTAENLLENDELTINIVSEWFVDAANYTAIDAPADKSEWDITGLTPVDSTVVNVPHVAESAFSIEAKVMHKHELKSKKGTHTSGMLFVIEGLKFHVREDIINEEQNDVDLEKYKPVGRLGGAKYTPISSFFELGRPLWNEESTTDGIKNLNLK